MDAILNKIIKILTVSLISIILIIGTIFIVPPSYAISTDDFELNYSSSIDYDEYMDGLSIFKYDYPYDGERYSAFRLTVEDQPPIYLFCVGASIGNYNNSLYLVCKTEDKSLFDSGDIIQYCKPNGSTYYRISYFDSTNGDFSYYNVTSPYNSYNISDIYLPNYDTLEEGFTALETFVNSSGSLSYESTLTIEPGYVAYCLCEGGSVTLNTIMPLNSNLNIIGQPKWDSMARIAFGVQRPAVGTVLTDSFGSLINWQKNSTAPSNILGMTKYAQAIYNDLPADGSFVAIYNPAYYGDDLTNPTQAPPITASFTNLGAVAKYPINTQVAYTPALGWNVQSGSDSDWNEYGLAIPSTNGAITTSDYIMSTTSQPAIEFPDGGYNDSSNVNNDAGSVLQRIIQPIINLLKAPIEHIQSLINQGSAFMRSIAQLFTWLPSPVLTVLVDALIVCIVIGAIKLLF